MGDRQLLLPVSTYLNEKKTEEELIKSGQKAVTVESEYAASLKKTKTDDSELLMDVDSYLNMKHGEDAVAAEQRKARVENKEHDFTSYADLMKSQTKEIKTSVDGLQE